MSFRFTGLMSAVSIFLFSLFAFSSFSLTFAAGLPGDANGDGVVNQLDFNQVKDDFGTQGGPSDLNSDAIVDVFDLNIVISNYGQLNPSSTPVPSVPATPLPSPSYSPIPSIPPSPAPSPSPIPSPSASNWLWISPQELSQLPMGNDPAWLNLKEAADTEVTTPDIDVRNQENTYILAKALVYARDNSQTCGNYDGLNCRQQVAQLLGEVIGTQGSGNNGDVLAVVRNLGAYVIAADLIDLKNFNYNHPDHSGQNLDGVFRNWLGGMLVNQVGNTGSCTSVVQCDYTRPNNFGTHASASRIAAALYLDDTYQLNEAIKVFKGWLGDRSSYDGFSYSDPYDWHPIRNPVTEEDPHGSPINPVGINPVGATINGNNVDGVLPDDQRRQIDHGCPAYSWPPCKETYVWEALQGAVTAAELLHRAGYDAYNWQNLALLRAYTWLHDPDGPTGSLPPNWFPAEGDDRWQPWIVNKRYGTNFPTSANTTPGEPSDITPGKNMGWTDWTHAN